MALEQVPVAARVGQDGEVQADLARSYGVSQSTISRRPENGPICSLCSRGTQAVAGSGTCKRMPGLSSVAQVSGSVSA